MSLTPGTRIGTYEIVGDLGAGGMGEVYRARDSRLARDVAIKVLPAFVSDDREQLARFEREATILASLNHPNIAHVYGLEKAADISALVMELVDGDDLAAKLDAGPLPIDQIVTIASQIADGLSAAHERGIVHRDLKPANIKIRRDGIVKVLDFGLAKTMAKPSSTEATMTRQDLTGAGIIVGTPAYMSPEQIAGDAVDARTDVWAFGCVLFEMISGRKAFDGNSGVERISAVLKSDPDWKAIAAAPQNLQSLVRRCLQKDAARRLGSIADAKMWLEDATTTAPAAQSSSTRWIAIAASVIAIAAIGVASWMGRPVSIAPRQLFRLQIAFRDPFLLTGRPPGANVALSPVGDEIVYHALSADSYQLVRRRLDSLETVPVAGTDLAQSPAFSPDGKRLAFFSRGAIRTVPVTGGTPALVCEVTGKYPNIAWTDDGFIWFGGIGESVFRVAERGGTPALVATPDASKGMSSFGFLAPLPGGAVVTIHRPPQGSPDRGRVVAIAADGRITTLVDDTDGFGAAYGGGHLIFQSAGKLIAAPFDAKRLAVTGDRFSIAETGANQLVASRDGTIVYMSVNLTTTSASDRTSLRLLTHDGRVERTISTEAPLARQVRISPDGKSVIVVQGPLNFGQLWRYPLGSQSQPIKITSGGSTGYPVWRPDGRELAYQSFAAKGSSLMTIASDGSASEPTPLLAGNDVVPEDWSPDGTTVIYQTTTAKTGTDLMLLNRATGAQTPWLQTPANEAEARFSPDGKWVTYVSDQTGRAEVWIRAVEGGAAIRVSADGGHQPRWSPSGKSVYFTNGTRMMASDVSTTASLTASTPRQLFEGGFLPYNSTYRRTFDVTADDRFLVTETAAVEPNQPLVVLLNALGSR